MQGLCPPADLASLVLPQTYGIRKKRVNIYDQSEYIDNHQNPLLPRHWYLHLLLARVTIDMWLRLSKSTGSSQSPLWGWTGFCANVSQGSPGLDCPLARSSGHIRGTLMIQLATRNQKFSFQWMPLPSLRPCISTDQSPWTSLTSNKGTHSAAASEDPSGHATPYYPWTLWQNIFEAFPGCFQSPPGCVLSSLMSSYTSMLPSPEKTWA